MRVCVFVTRRKFINIPVKLERQDQRGMTENDTGENSLCFQVLLMMQGFIVHMCEFLHAECTNTITPKFPVTPNYFHLLLNNC